MTTCKRLDLFCRTVNSLLNVLSPSDLELIGEWVVVDDNSSSEDRLVMQTTYPFMTFIWKSIEQKGHARSMNLLIKHIRTTPYKYQLHIEDDWLFFEPSSEYSYLQRMIDILEEDGNLGQVLYNQNYMELVSETHISGGKFMKTINSKTHPTFNYAVHEHWATERDQTLWREKWGMTSSSAYWPHFSLRPGLWHIERVYGPIFNTWFDTTAAHFEMAFAKVYGRRLQTAFLIGPHCQHIGKHTSDQQTLNAYAMNGEAQFLPDNTMRKTNQLDHRALFYVLNLNRRRDRMDRFNKETQYLSPIVQRYGAVDGKRYILQPHDYLLFAKNDYNYRAGIVGCALSHINMWKNWIANPSSLHWMCVFEDDVHVVDKENLESQLFQVVNEAERFPEVDLIFIGYSPMSVPPPAPKDTPLSLEVVAHPQILGMMGGIFAYMVTKRGAMTILQYIEEEGMGNAVDTMMLRCINAGRIQAMRVHPYGSIITSELGYAATSDSDIQKDFTSLAVPIEQLIESELKLLNLLGCNSAKVETSPPSEDDKSSEDFVDFVYPLRNVYVRVPYNSIRRENLEFLRSHRPNKIQLL